jgi:molybdopterin-guanine dinucleotide biosynthesis protein A
MRIPKARITGLILAGGMGSRMGGVDKGLQDFAGQPMVSQVIQRLQPQVGPLLINANRHLDQYASFGLPVCTDLMQGYAGPLAGLQAGLTQCTTDYLLSVPCDSPLLPTDLAQRLADALADHDADAALPVTIEDGHRHRQPVFLLLKAALLPSLSSWLLNGGRKVDDWLATLHCVELAFDDPLAFANANTRDELDALARR